MRIFSTGLTFAALIALGACAGNTNKPNDVGNMALPTVGTPGRASTVPTGPDVGSMTAPSGSGGAVSRPAPGSTVPDTGNMALPPAAQGNSAPRRY